MKRLSVFLITVGLAALGWSRPADLTVRLYWIRAPATVRIVPQPGGTHIRLCPPCDEQSLVEPATVRADDENIHFGSNEGRYESIELRGSYRLETREHSPLKLAHPLTFRASGGRLQLTAQVSLEDYVAAVLAGESNNFTSGEALKAMAVAARTYAVRFRGRHQNEGFDFCDTTHCQDARFGIRLGRLEKAAEATEGELLWHQGKPAATYYHKNCGGATEAVEHAWPGSREPHLRQRAEAGAVHDRGEWSSTIRKADLQQALRRASLAPPRQIEAVAIVARTPSGRVAHVRLEGAPALSLSAEALRRAVGQTLGWGLIRSDLYDVRAAGDRLVFHGFGAGHGVGLCQVGAAHLGKQGRTYQEILAAYYPDTTLGLTAAGLKWQPLAGERIELLTTQAQADQGLLVLAERLLRETEETTKWTLSRRPQLRVFPTLSDFRDATGEPGWVAASTRGRVIRLQPVGVLRSSGTLEPTLRHEFVHLLVEGRAAPGLPLWFREGVVLYLAGGRVPANSPQILSLDEIERILQNPASRQELAQAYAGARARVAALVDVHGRVTVLRWVERGLPPDLLLGLGNQATQPGRQQ